MINLNGELVNELPEAYFRLQRGLYYADSLFESLRVYEGSILFLAQHWERLQAGMQAMGYSIPVHWGLEFFKNQILLVSPKNARIRFTVWRQAGGLYHPEKHFPEFLITASETSSVLFPWHEMGHSACLCEMVRLPIDGLSGLKTLNAARYVAAAVEAQRRGFEDAIILNAQNSVCEAVSGNLFWFEGDNLCAAHRGNGALTGIMQNLLFALTKQLPFPLVEKSATFAQLLMADEVFTTNAVRGINWISKLEGTALKNQRTKRVREIAVTHILQNLHI